MSEEQRPILDTVRLKLRPFMLDDAPEVQRLAGDKDIASTTGNIPHPYEDGIAEQWIESHQGRFEAGELVNFAITHRHEAYLIGAVGLIIDKDNESANLGYWIGKPYWNNGYCTEAAQTVVNYGFQILGLNRIQASHMTRNPASGRVMQKIGMQYEGCSRQRMKKWGVFEDMDYYGILKSDYITS